MCVRYACLSRSHICLRSNDTIVVIRPAFSCASQTKSSIRTFANTLFELFYKLIDVMYRILYLIIKHLFDDDFFFSRAITFDYHSAYDLECAADQLQWNLNRTINSLPHLTNLQMIPFNLTQWKSYIEWSRVQIMSINVHWTIHLSLWVEHLSSYIHIGQFHIQWVKGYLCLALITVPERSFCGAIWPISNHFIWQKEYFSW